MINKKMNTNESYITDNKKTENTQSNKYKKENLVEIKQSLFQALTTQSSKKIKYRDNDESLYKNPRFINYINFRNYEDNSIQDIALTNKEKHKNKLFKTEKKKSNQIYKRNDNDTSNLMNTYTNSQIQNQNLFNYSNTFFNIDKFNKNDDLMYIVTTNKNNDNENMFENNKEKEIEDYNESRKFYKRTSHIALPFCQYHKYNIKLPKKYTCNFKKCSCCGVPEYINMPYTPNENYINRTRGINKYNNNNRYSKYSFSEKDNGRDKDIVKPEKQDYKKFKFKSVLDQLKNKNKNHKNLYERINKSKISESSESNQISDFEFNFQKPNNINTKIPKNYFNYDISENEKEFENSNDDSSNLELPDDFIINDEKDLNNYKNLVDKSDKKPKTHFSVMYYKRLNKSYNQVFSKDVHKPINKSKNIELLRE